MLFFFFRYFFLPFYFCINVIKKHEKSKEVFLERRSGFQGYEEPNDIIAINRPISTIYTIGFNEKINKILIMHVLKDTILKKPNLSGIKHLK